MSDATGPDPMDQMAAAMGGMGGQQPSEEQMRQAMAQMRATPVDQFVAGALQELLTAGQVKLGRNDGRLLLDLVSVLNDATRGEVDEQLTQQVDDALSQLRMAQVQAEREIVQAATEGHVEQNDLPRRPPKLELQREEREPAPAGEGEAGQDATAAEGGPQQGTQQSSGQTGSSAASRLWVPGR